MVGVDLYLNLSSTNIYWVTNVFMPKLETQQNRTYSTYLDRSSWVMYWLVHTELRPCWVLQEIWCSNSIWKGLSFLFLLREKLGYEEAKYPQRTYNHSSMLTLGRVLSSIISYIEYNIEYDFQRSLNWYLLQ